MKQNDDHFLKSQINFSVKFTFYFFDLEIEELKLKI